MKWHEEARSLRGSGWKLVEIGKRFGVTTERARQVCSGIVCPIKHQAMHFADPDWRASHPRTPHLRNEREAFIRAHYKQDMSASEIGAALGITRNAVIGSARDLGLTGE